MSLIHILQKPISARKNPLIFVRNGEILTDRTWYSLTNDNTLPFMDLQFDRVNLYNAVRGYLDEQGIKYKPQGENPLNILLRLDEESDIITLMHLFAKVKRNNEIEARIHSGEEEKAVIKFREQLTTYASKYK